MKYSELLRTSIPSPFLSPQVRAAVPRQVGTFFIPTHCTHAVHQRSFAQSKAFGSSTHHKGLETRMDL